MRCRCDQQRNLVLSRSLMTATMWSRRSTLRSGVLQDEQLDKNVSKSCPEADGRVDGDVNDQHERGGSWRQRAESVKEDKHNIDLDRHSFFPFLNPRLLPHHNPTRHPLIRLRRSLLALIRPLPKLLQHTRRQTRIPTLITLQFPHLLIRLHKIELPQKHRQSDFRFEKS